MARHARTSPPPDRRARAPDAKVLAEVKRLFTGREAAVEHAFQGGEAFRSLCRDYLTCFAALEHWRNSHSTEAHERSAEYAELVSELATEIDARLARDER